MGQAAGGWCHERELLEFKAGGGRALGWMHWHCHWHLQLLPYPTKMDAEALPRSPAHPIVKARGSFISRLTARAMSAAAGRWAGVAALCMCRICGLARGYGGCWVCRRRRV